MWTLIVDACALAARVLLALAGLLLTQPAQDLPRRIGEVTEQYACCDARYGSVRDAAGHRLRTITTTPRGTARRRMGILFVPWLSCDSTAVPAGDSGDGWAQTMRGVIERSGAVVMRIDKAGTGDSEGECASTDFETEFSGYLAAVRSLRVNPDVDPSRIVLFGGSIGGAVAPLLALEEPVSAVAVWATSSTTWLEHLIGVERRRMTLGGAAPGAVSEAMPRFVRFHTAFLLDGLAPGDVPARFPDLAGLWYDEPTGLYGRPARWHQQLQRRNVSAAWARLTVPVLSMSGEFDWIMSREDQDPIADIVGPARARAVRFAATDHNFMRYPSPAAAFREVGGTFNRQPLEALLAWLASLT